jgi:hypothetical protein
MLTPEVYCNCRSTILIFCSAGGGLAKQARQQHVSQCSGVNHARTERSMCASDLALANARADFLFRIAGLSRLCSRACRTSSHQQRANA